MSHDLLEEMINISKLGFIEQNKSFGFFIMDGNDVTFYNSDFYKRFGIQTQQATFSDWSKIIVQSEKDSLIDAVEYNYSKLNTVVNSRYKVKDTNGSIVWIEATAIHVHDEKLKTNLLVGTHLDITDSRAERYDFIKRLYLNENSLLFNREKLFNDIKYLYNMKSKSALFILMHIKNYDYLLNFIPEQEVYDYIKTFNHRVNEHLGDDFSIYHVTDDLFILLTPSLMKYESNLIQYNEWVDKLVGFFKTSNLSIEPKISMTSLFMHDLEEYKVFFNDSQLVISNLSLEHKKVITKKDLEHIVRKIFIKENIINSIKLNEFYNVYQPIIKTNNHLIHGFEVLARWNNSTYGEIYPDEFISIAEENHEIIQLGYTVIKNAFQFISSNKELEKYFFNINLSVLQLKSPHFIDKLMQFVNQYQIKCSSIHLEITESLDNSNVDKIVPYLNELKTLGFKIFLDDYGVGYHSWYTLSTLPIDGIKIDKNVMNDFKDNAMMNNLLISFSKLCHDNKITLVAEGIEFEYMIKKVIELNIDYLQGYYFFKPLTEKQVLKTIENRR